VKAAPTRLSGEATGRRGAAARAVASPRPSSRSAAALGLDDVERLVRLVAETGIGEIALKMGGVEVRIVRAGGDAGRAGDAPQVHFLPMAGPGSPPWPTGALLTGAPAPAAPAGAATSSAPAAPVEEEEGLHVLTASMVGTFYRRPHPEAQAFVKEGDVIKKGQVVCILEAMKIMNEIEADVAGTVVRILAEDGQPVEYGEQLMVVRPL
jgi:acetyl-CoA carboxylase biotin carboxyl carrier protein